MDGVMELVGKRKTLKVFQRLLVGLNYLSCSTRVRSEIVVPILKEGIIVGELDIDSHELSPFTEEDVEFLERICQRIGDLF